MTTQPHFVYILTNQHATILYIGATNNPVRRIWQHKNKLIEGFTKKYNINRLIYIEEQPDSASAYQREKQIKKYSRIKKLDLIQKQNPKLKDLYQYLPHNKLIKFGR